MGEIKKVAYLRALEATKQCELTFLLSVKLENVGLLEEEVRAVRQITDTVQSLLQHIVNKIKKSIKTLSGKGEDDTDNDIEINVALIKAPSQKAIKADMVLQNLISSNMKIIEFHIFNRPYMVLINAPLVKELKLPQIIYANFTIQPRKFYCLFTEHSLSQFSWFKSEDKEKWIQVGSTYKYKVAEDDNGHFLKLVCLPRNSALAGPSVEVISENKVEVIGDLPTCPFEERHKFTTKKLNGNHFRMVSYNVLSSRYTENGDSFSYCPPNVLAIDYRKQLVGKELLGYQPDIICLQEVDANAFSTYYKEIFKKNGYMTYYHRKGNKISEGSACFFNKTRFKKIDDHQIIYCNEIKQKMFTYLWNFIKANPELKECFMRQMTSLQVSVLLKTSRKNECIIIGNTHLFYHPDAELVRVLQINMATTYLQSLSKRHSEYGSVKVILCGDFNSVPSSSVYKYMTSGKLEKDDIIFEKTKNNPDLFHNFNFESACGLPKYTNYTKDFRNCLDYIFIEKDKIKIHKTIPFPKNEELEKYEGLPNEVYPSDHLALVVDMEII